MADGYTTLNPGQGGSVMDEEDVSYGSGPATRKRPRIVLTGANQGEVVRVLDSDPAGNECAIVTRNIPSGVQAVSGDVNALVQLPGPPVSQFNLTTLVPYGVETTVCSYTVPTGYTFHAVGFVASGTVNALFKFYLDTTVKMAGRNSVAEPTVQLGFNYAYPSLGEGLMVKVTATHLVSGVSADFEATILGYLT